jgi:hypothetical protein
MNHLIKSINVFIWLPMILACVSCNPIRVDKVEEVNRSPKIFPDYNEITIPVNIAPLNFKVEENGSFFLVNITTSSAGNIISIKSSNGIIRIPLKAWKKIIEASQENSVILQVYSKEKKYPKTIKYKPIIINVANQPIDPWLVYRLIPPGYYSWSKIKIVQRSLENFKETSIAENQLTDQNCINCHSFQGGNPDKFLFHVRGSRGGTYFVDSDKIQKKNIKTENMPGGATYPSWHPDGKFVVFSSNQVRQNFYAHSSRTIEVYDLISSLILFDTERDEITSISSGDSVIPLETFPTWSPDGAYLYYCEANSGLQGDEIGISNIKNIHYKLKRRSFDQDSGTFGEPELVFNASEYNKSVSFPKISPDGKFLVFTLADYGTFPVWHKEADLYVMNLENGIHQKMDLNSEDTESYHTWSSNGSWLIFSSKRLDGRSTRPFISYIDQNGNASKPFLLPQKNPDYYHQMVESFNIPELISGKIKINPRSVEAASRLEAVTAKQKPADEVPGWRTKEKSKKPADTEPGIHE